MGICKWARHSWHASADRASMCLQELSSRARAGGLHAFNTKVRAMIVYDGVAKVVGPKKEAC